MKILVLSDSRGIHRPAGAKHQMYSARLAKVPGIQVTSLLCPFQWTTIPDFLQILSANETYAPSLYDHVILHAGIVDHSPRPLQQMLAQLYSPEAVPEPHVVHQLRPDKRRVGKKCVS